MPDAETDDESPPFVNNRPADDAPADGTPDDVDTEGAAPIYDLAPWVKRASAAVVDYGASYAFYVAGLILAASTGLEALATLGVLGAVVHWFWNYVWVFGRTGQTIGKRFLNIQLVSTSDAQPVGPLAVITRHFLHVLDSIAFLGYLLPLVDSMRQTLADKILRTVVIERRPPMMADYG